MTEPLTLAQRLEQRAKTMNGSLVGASDGNTYAIGYYDQFAAADDKEAVALIASLRDANKALTAAYEGAINSAIAEERAKTRAQGRAEAAEAKLAKVEAELYLIRNARDNLSDNVNRLSAELAEARAACEAALLACSLRAASMGDVVYPDDYDGPLAEDCEAVARSFLASKEASHAE